MSDSTNHDSTAAERDDVALVRDLVASGSPSALADLYRRHATAVYRLAFRITGQRSDAEDVLQDVFVGLRRALERYEERGAFASWLLKVTARTALMHRRRSRRAEHEPLTETAPLGEGASLDAADRLAVDRLAAERALAAMPESQRVVFMLKEVQGYSHDEIARLLGVRVGTCRVRLHRAWKFLENRMEKA